ncbi:MAG: 3'-5' exonuclease, partial [Bacteroidales bacterium]|nr:3'-5' exonuclease [Bacteroidales bacterium]
MTNTDFKLNLTRPLCVFDLETTGLTIGRDRIVEIAVIKVMPDGSENRLHLYIDPEMEIPQESSDIHGLTNAKLKELGAKPLAECAAEITAFIGNSDLAGFNSNKFDIP